MPIVSVSSLSSFSSGGGDDDDSSNSDDERLEKSGRTFAETTFADSAHFLRSFSRDTLEFGGNDGNSNSHHSAHSSSLRASTVRSLPNYYDADASACDGYLGDGPEFSTRTRSNHTRSNRTSRSVGSSWSEQGYAKATRVWEHLRALVYAEEPSSPAHRERQTDLCCAVCCDVLRACIIVDAVYLGMLVGGLGLSALGVAVFNPINLSDVYDDDAYTQVVRISALPPGYPLELALAMLGAGTMFAAVGIYGAARFRPVPVLMTGIWYCVDVVNNCLWINWAFAVVLGCFAYPHFVLFGALRNGTIARETYAKERHCCCDTAEDDDDDDPEQ